MAAGLYNLAWGIYSAVDPQWLFRLAGMPLLNHPAVFACLVLSLTNDFAWWLPFGLYLYDAWPAFRASRRAVEEASREA